MVNLRFAAVLGATLLVCANAQAAPIFSQTPALVGLFSSDSDGLDRLADDFVIAGDDVVRSIVWEGAYEVANTPPPLDDFTVSFYADAGGTLGALLQSFHVGNPLTRTLVGTVGGSSLFRYGADLGAGFSVAGGTAYWISLVNDTSTDLDDTWAWPYAPGLGGQMAFSTDGGTSWTSAHGGAVFTLDNANVAAVPEPSSLLLAALGVAAAARRFRR